MAILQEASGDKISPKQLLINRIITELDPVFVQNVVDFLEDTGGVTATHLGALDNVLADHELVEYDAISFAKQLNAN